MPPTKFQLNLTYRSGADVVSGFSRWPPWWPSWILERNEFSNSKSPSHPPSLGSIRLTVQEQMCSEDFQDGHRGGVAILAIGTGMTLAILNLYVAPMPLIKFQLNQPYCLEGDAV